MYFLFSFLKVTNPFLWLDKCVIWYVIKQDPSLHITYSLIKIIVTIVNFNSIINLYDLKNDEISISYLVNCFSFKNIPCIYFYFILHSVIVGTILFCYWCTSRKKMYNCSKNENYNATLTEYSSD